MPLPVAHVLPDLFPEHFLPDGKTNGDWIDQFGFLRGSDPKANDGLPVGFAISNYRPQSGAPSPFSFVGFSCALCHSTQLRESSDQKGEIRYGPGSISLEREQKRCATIPRAGAGIAAAFQRAFIGRTKIWSG
jgi:hypothetical protein